jgi:regulator of sigma E protease
VSWVWTVLGIIALIVLHELGHFGVAKAVGMRVERFSLFFPPTLWRVRRGETEYAIGAIPAGGYVKITGMNPEELGDMDPEVTRRAYYNQAPWKRIAVVLAGPLVNVVIAFVLFWAVLVSGNLDGAYRLEALSPGVHTLAGSRTVHAAVAGKPAAGVLRKGDVILAVDGRPTGHEGIVEAISAHRCAGTPVDGCRASTPVRLLVRRGGREVSLALYPRYDGREKRMLVGVEFDPPRVRSLGVLAAAGASVNAMWHTTTETLSGFARALTESKVRHEISSIVGITQHANQEVTAGAGYALVFLGLISLVLAVINLFPFLPLDGGHILWSLAEKLRGRRISLMAMYRFSSVGIVLLLFLVINGVSNDISRLAG